MAKDPAFLFYPGDYLRDTQCLSEPAQVAYDRIMCEHMRSKLISKQQFTFFTKRLTEDQRSELLMVLNETEEGYQITWVADSIDKRKAYTESRRKSRLKSDEDNVRIYIVRDNVRSTYKIGSSVNPIRRYNELNNQKNPAHMADPSGSRNITLIWYSDPVLRSEESKLHKRFSDKNLFGEWFNLTKQDLNYIFKTYDGTYVERTENVNEIENANVIVIGIKKENSITVRAVYADEKLKRIYDLKLYFEQLEKLQEFERAGFVCFDEFMQANPANEFKDDNHLYNAFRKFHVEKQLLAAAAKSGKKKLTLAEIDGTK